MSLSSNYSEEALMARESLFRRKLSQLRTTGEIRRLESHNQHNGFREIEQGFYLNNVSASWVNGDPRQLEKLALLDSQTELYNHDTINRMLKDEVKRAMRYQKSLSVLAIGVDELSKQSHLNGGSVCDFLLRDTAQLLMKLIRDVDIPGRYDRERFLILCPETESHGASCLAERLRHNIRHNKNSNTDNDWRITVSIGVVAFPNPAQNDQQLISLALQGLRVAQQCGGNTIRTAK